MSLINKLKNKGEYSDSFHYPESIHPIQKMHVQVDKLQHPVQTNKALYGKYSSSQTYYYSTVVGDIVKQRRTQSNINFQDVEYISDPQQYLKRSYLRHEFQSKMSTFKQYYFYHEDCPRIFMKHIDQMYSKWQDRKRDLVYKKLKVLYNESLSSDGSGSRDQTNRSVEGLTHFLLEISDYNPFSKKYYLRQEVQDKERLKQQQQDAKGNKSKEQDRTVDEISSLNHNISAMLHDISQLSAISTLDQQQSPRFSTLYHSKKLKVNYSSQNSTYHNSQSASNLHNSVKFNFKKNKYLPSKEKDNDKMKGKEKERFIQQIQNKILSGKESVEDKHAGSGGESSHGQQQENVHGVGLQNFDKNKLRTNQVSSKSKSIIQLSSFNPSRKSQTLFNLNLNLNPHKKQTLKLEQDKNAPARSNRINLENKAGKNYQSEKRSLLKSQSQKKMPHILTQQERIGLQSTGKRSVPLLKQSSKAGLNIIQTKGSSRDILHLNPKSNEFADNKLQKTQQSRFRSHKSQYLSLPKSNLQSRGGSPSKVTLKVNQQRKYLNKDKGNIIIAKKGHQLKLQ